MKTYTIRGGRVLRVERTPYDRNGNRGARVYVQAALAGPLHILTISGRSCPPNVERWEGRRFLRIKYRAKPGSNDGRMLPESDPYHREGERVPDLRGTEDDGDAHKAGCLLGDLLNLETDSAGRFLTIAGTKTAAGLARTVERIVNEEAGK